MGPMGEFPGNLLSFQGFSNGAAGLLKRYLLPICNMLLFQHQNQVGHHHVQVAMFRCFSCIRIFVQEVVHPHGGVCFWDSICWGLQVYRPRTSVRFYPAHPLPREGSEVRSRWSGALIPSFRGGGGGAVWPSGSTLSGFPANRKKKQVALSVAKRIPGIWMQWGKVKWTFKGSIDPPKRRHPKKAPSKKRVLEWFERVNQMETNHCHYVEIQDGYVSKWGTLNGGCCFPLRPPPKGTLKRPRSRLPVIYGRSI